MKAELVETEDIEVHEAFGRLVSKLSQTDNDE
jgi:hypothetical protein